MPRREYRSTFRCAEPGCRETQFFVHDTRADQNASYKRQNEHPFKCTRHAHPEQNLRLDNLTTRHVLVATLVNDRFLSWHEEGLGRSGSGFTFGPGFNAHASDFPEGTRLIVTAQIEMPTDPEAEAIRAGEAVIRVGGGMGHHGGRGARALRCPHPLLARGRAGPGCA